MKMSHTVFKNLFCVFLVVVFACFCVYVLLPLWRNKHNNKTDMPNRRHFTTREANYARANLPVLQAHLCESSACRGSDTDSFHLAS